MMVKSRPPEYRRLVDVDGTVQPAYLYHTSGCIVSEERSGCHDVLIFSGGFVDLLSGTIGLDWMDMY